MANDRMWLKCKGCGETFLLGKTLCEGYYLFEPETFVRRLNDFFDKHAFCVEAENGGGKIQTFELVYDSDVYDEKNGNEKGWIDVNVQMPPVDQEVLCKVTAPFCRYSVLLWDGQDWCRWANPIKDVKGWFAAGMEVTHWKLIEL